MNFFKRKKTKLGIPHEKQLNATTKPEQQRDCSSTPDCPMCQISPETVQKLKQQE